MQMPKILDGNGKELFVDFFFLRQSYKDQLDKLDLEIKNLNIKTLKSYSDLDNLFRNRFLEKVFICFVSGSANVKNKRNFFNTIIRIQFTKIDQDAIPEGMMLGLTGDIDPEQNVLNVKSFFLTRQKAVPLPFETLINNVKSQSFNLKNFSKEELARRNIINSDSIDKIGIMLSGFEEEKLKWMNYINFKNDLSQLRKNNSIPYFLNKYYDDVLRVEIKNIKKEQVQFFKENLIIKSTTFVYLKSIFEIQLNNFLIPFERLSIISLNTVVLNEEKNIRSLLKLGGILMNPISMNRNITSLSELKSKPILIMQINFSEDKTQYNSINLSEYIATEKNEILFIDFWRRQSNFILGNMPKEEEIFKQSWLQDTKIKKIWFEISDDFDENILKDYTLDGLNAGYLTVTNIGDDVLIDRNAKILTRISNGRVKNPYLANYLFNTSLIDISDHNDLNDLNIKFHFNLNEIQQLAVKKALSSKDIFLLQGPPGTGKTQVISEISYQLIKMGKKILISSQNHEAIDNVIDRLPLEPDLIKIRILNEFKKQKNKFQEFSPERLTYNYYRSIKKIISKNLSEANELFKDTISEVSRLDKFNADFLSMKNIRDLLIKYNDELKNINDEILNLKNAENQLIEEKNLIEEEVYNLENLKNAFLTLNFDVGIINNDTVKEIFEKNISDNFLDLSMKLLKDNYKKDNWFMLFKLVEAFFYKNNENYKKWKKLKYKSDMETDAEKKDAINFELISIENLLENDNEYLIFKNITIKISNSIQIVINNLKQKNFLTKGNDNSINELLIKKNAVEKSISNLKKTSNSGLKNIQEQLDIYNYRYKTNFNLSDEGLLNDLQKNLEEFEKLKNQFIEKQNSLKPVLQNIEEFLESHYKISDEFISSNKFSTNMKIDSKRYNTEMLNEMANLFAFTLTSKTRFDYKNKIEEQLGISDLNLDFLNVDTVIIDEASKATMLELIMPLVFGKNLILVGDYRQLPPIFGIRPEEVEIVNEAKNLNYDFEEFESLLTKSVFKLLIINANDSIKEMLKIQYRSSQQIMEVVNFFYGGELTMNSSNEINKQHFLDIKSSINNKIITPENSVYWIDSSKNKNDEIVFEGNDENSTSIFNQNEIDITIELIKKINDSLNNSNNFVKPTLAIISFYKLHVRKIKGEYLKIKNNIKNIIIVISTVDDFQGKEAEFVIVNMVRNPKKLSNSSREFIRKYERINVAFSRAQKLLIIVGAERSVANVKVEIPNISDPSLIDTFAIYDDIISRIKHWNSFLIARDIFE